MVKSSRLGVGLDLTIPCIVEIDFGKASEKLRFVSLRQLLNRFDDFTHRAHDGKLIESFCYEKQQKK